jgi:hypothetical protein
MDTRPEVALLWRSRARKSEEPLAALKSCIGGLVYPYGTIYTMDNQRAAVAVSPSMS